MGIPRYQGQPHEFCGHVAAGLLKSCPKAHESKCNSQRVSRFQPNEQIAAEVAALSDTTSMLGFSVGVSWCEYFQRLAIWETLDWQGRLSDMIEDALPPAWIMDPERWIFDTGRELLKAAQLFGPVTHDGRRVEVKWYLTNEDGSPRDVSRWDIQAWLDLRHGHGENPMPALWEHNYRLDAFWQGQATDRDGDIANRMGSTRGDGRAGGGIVGAGGPTSGRDSRQYICRHRMRNVACKICKPVKKTVFLGGQKSGTETTGYESVDLRDHFESSELVEAEG